jgi:hypothetical protein
MREPLRVYAAYSVHSVEEARLGRIRLTGLADRKTCVGRLVPHGNVYDGSARDGRTINSAALF